MRVKLARLLKRHQKLNVRKINGNKLEQLFNVNDSALITIHRKW